MKYTPKQYAQALYLAIAESRPADQDKILDNFVQVLRQNQALGIMDEIEGEYYNFEKASKGIKTASVTTAHKLSGSEEQKIIKELNEFIGGKVELKKQVNEGLMGGVIIRIEDQLIDGSVKKQLEELKNELKKAS